MACQRYRISQKSSRYLINQIPGIWMVTTNLNLDPIKYECCIWCQTFRNLLFYNIEPFCGISISLIDYHRLIILYFFLKIKYICCVLHIFQSVAHYPKVITCTISRTRLYYKALLSKHLDVILFCFFKHNFPSFGTLPE